MRATGPERGGMPHAGGAGEPADQVILPARRERPVSQVPLAERVTVGVTRHAPAELAQQGRDAEFVTDDGTHVAPLLCRRMPLPG